MKRLFVVGDSWIFPSQVLPGTHFTEIFANKFNFLPTYLSQPGISNAVISLQIDTAIQHEPDLVLLSLTDINRTEFAINYKNSFEDITLSNVHRYVEHESIKSVLADDTTTLCSMNWTTLLDDNQDDDLNIDNWKNKKELLRLVYKNLYLENWKKFLDIKVLLGSMYLLEQSKIPYIICVDHCNFDRSDFKGTKGIKYSFVNEKNDLRDSIMTVIKNNPRKGPEIGYHTDPETQILIADILIAHYQNYF